MRVLSLHVRERRGTRACAIEKLSFRRTHTVQWFLAAHTYAPKSCVSESIAPAFAPARNASQDPARRGTLRCATDGQAGESGPDLERRAKPSAFVAFNALSARECIRTAQLPSSVLFYTALFCSVLLFSSVLLCSPLFCSVLLRSLLLCANTLNRARDFSATPLFAPENSPSSARVVDANTHVIEFDFRAVYAQNRIALAAQ